jgi:hypothetical protein
MIAKNSPNHEGLVIHIASLAMAVVISENLTCPEVVIITVPLSNPIKMIARNRMAVVLQDFSWDRMIAAVEAVRERACRATNALKRAGIPYAVAGGNAVAAWVDRAAVRNTQDVDILIRRSDFDAVRSTLESVGFHYRNIAGIDCLIDGANGRTRDAVHLLFASEKVRPEHPSPAADVSEAIPADDYAVLSLEALVRMKLNSFCDKDRTHLRDLIEVGLIDATWIPRLIPEHAERLQHLLDDPDGRETLPRPLSPVLRKLATKPDETHFAR